LDQHKGSIGSIDAKPRGSPIGLQTSVYTVKTWNEAPIRFVWRKEADEILVTPGY
jgi:hypothetical protein